VVSLEQIVGFCMGTVWQNVPVEMLTVVGQFLTLLVDIGDEKGCHGLN
jgi:hypothetical protein